MIIDCEQCGRKGLLEEERYFGKKLRLRCPYCSQAFIYAVAGNGSGAGSALIEENTHSSIAATIVRNTPAVEDDVIGSAPTGPVSVPPPITVSPSLPVAEPAQVVPPPAQEEHSAEHQAAILEAKRIARLIISEIKLYNQEKIGRARSKKEVLDLLKNDLMKGKQHYNTRIASKLPAGPDYFTETVKEILLAGKG